ncbi:MAG: hypothetical protein ACJ78Q_09785 [Chloroflexia bacterium]
MDGTGKRRTNSYLFLVRLWPDEEEGEQPAWHGKVQHVMTGRAGTFDGWPTLVAMLQDMLAGDGSDAGTAADDGRGLRRTTDDGR